jgi:hypothetical protein
MTKWELWVEGYPEPVSVVANKAASKTKRVELVVHEGSGKTTTWGLVRELELSGPDGVTCWVNLDYLVGYRLADLPLTATVGVRINGNVEEIRVDGTTPPKVESGEGIAMLNFWGTNEAQPVAGFVLQRVTGWRLLDRR